MQNRKMSDFEFGEEDFDVAPSSYSQDSEPAETGRSQHSESPDALSLSQENTGDGVTLDLDAEDNSARVDEAVEDVEEEEDKDSEEEEEKLEEIEEVYAEERQDEAHVFQAPTPKPKKRHLTAEPIEQVRCPHGLRYSIIFFCFFFVF